MTATKTFEVGKTYSARSICDHDCIFSFTITARTAKTVTTTVHGKTVRRGLSIYSGEEQFKPFMPRRATPSSIAKGIAMTPAQTKKRREALLREQQEWQDRVKSAKAACDAITDPVLLADALRAWLLAKADLHAFHWPTDPIRGLPVTAMWRRRANNEQYRQIMACHWLAERAMKRADEITGLDAVEQKATADLAEAESSAFRAAIDAMLRQASDEIRSGR